MNDAESLERSPSKLYLEAGERSMAVSFSSWNTSATVTVTVGKSCDLRRPAFATLRR
jgi:hypothetical protein